MKILKVLLYTILTTCVLWFFVMIFGSSIIRYISTYYFGSSVNLIGVEVTPKLHLNINKAEFIFDDESGKLNSVGSVRAINLQFLDLISQPTANLTTGPVNIASIGNLENASVSIKIKSLFDLENQLFNAVLSGLSVNKSFSSDQLEVTGGLRFLENKIENLSFNFKNSQTTKPPILKAQKFGGTIDQIDILSPISKQSNKVALKINKLSGINPAFMAEFSTLEIKNKIGVLETSGTFLDLTLGNANIFTDEIRFEFTAGDILDPSVFLNLNFEADKATLSDFNLVLPEVSGSAEVTKNTAILEMVGPVSSFRIGNQKQFIGEVMGGNFRSSINYSLKPFSNAASGKLNFAADSDPSLVLGLDFSADVDGYCPQRSCEIEELRLEYELSVGNGTLLGSSECPYGRCFSSMSNHSIEIEDTNLLFSEVAQTRIFSPLALMAILSELNSNGIKTARGHRLSF